MKQRLITLLLFIIFPMSVFSQDFNPPFPRIGVIYFYKANVAPDIWPNKDLLIIRFWSPENQAAQKIKARYPNKIVLATNNIIDGIWLNPPPPDDWLINMTQPGLCLPGWHNTHPGDCLYDATDNAPLVLINGVNQRWSDYLTTSLADSTPWSYFDGSFFDSWAGSITWMQNYEYVDYDRDGIADINEAKTGQDWWLEGNQIIVNKLKSKSPAGKDIVVAHEASTDERGYLNGIGVEGWRGDNWDWEFNNLILPFADSSQTPQINIIEAKVVDPEDWAFARYAHTTATVAGFYVSFDEGVSAHRYTYEYDENYLNLGYPTSPPTEIRPGVWVRYFDNGVAIVNGSGTAQTITASDLSGGPYYHFQGNQDPVVNNGGQFTSITLSGSGADNPSNQTGDGVYLLKVPNKVVMAPIIVDNIAVNMTSPGQSPAVLTGNWTQQTQSAAENTNAFALNFGWDQYQYTYAYAPAGAGENYAVYNFNVNVTGEYDVYEWHPYHGNSNADFAEGVDVPYTITHANGTTTVLVDQSTNQGQWNYLGRFKFNAGGTASVKISNNVSGGDYVIADAIKLVYYDPGSANQPPSASFKADPYSGSVPLTVNFDASTSSDPDGSISSYSWDFGDGSTGTGITVTHTYTTTGSFTVTLTVTDDGGLNDTATDVISVRTPNEAPVAVAVASKTTQDIGLAIQFTGSNSYDPDADPAQPNNGIVFYSWDFGDGNSADVADTAYTYQSVGTYTVVLTVSDIDNLVDRDTLQVTIVNPQVQVTSQVPLWSKIVEVPSLDVKMPDNYIVSYNGKLYFRKNGAWYEISMVKVE